MITVNGKTVQAIVAYAAIVFGILTTQLQGIHLPALASAILGVFGVLLHPQTSITAPAVPVTTVAATLPKAPPTV